VIKTQTVVQGALVWFNVVWEMCLPLEVLGARGGGSSGGVHAL
jgi:hypothetical protein